MEKDEILELTAAIHQIVRLVPSGRATSYGALARAVGRPDHARLVGRIMGSSDSMQSALPAYRVVNSQGILTARAAFDTPTRMRELLEAEGVVVRNHRIADWKKIFWDPQKEL
jgi:methylated-DNA-protein-cysteine methyltransferase-like protein